MQSENRFFNVCVSRQYIRPAKFESANNTSTVYVKRPYYIFEILYRSTPGK